jgi:hypothetical protein
MEQLVARWAHNPKVTGSSPVPATEKGRFLTTFLFSKNKLYLLGNEFYSLLISLFPQLLERFFGNFR